MTARCTHDKCDLTVRHIHVSELESFRYWQNNDEDTEGTAGLVRRLRTPTFGANVQAGKAFAKWFEEIGDGGATFDAGGCDGWTFDFACNAEVEICPARELRAEMTVHTEIGPVLLVGHCDGINGRTVHDQKLTEKIDAEKYTDSLQWRAYLVMFEADTFVYDLFLARYQRRQGEIVPGRVTVAEYHRLPFYRYPGIENDVTAAVLELVHFMARHVPERMA